MTYQYFRRMDFIIKDGFLEVPKEKLVYYPRTSVYSLQAYKTSGYPYLAICPHKVSLRKNPDDISSIIISLESAVTDNETFKFRFPQFSLEHLGLGSNSRITIIFMPWYMEIWSSKVFEQWCSPTKESKAA